MARLIIRDAKESDISVIENLINDWLRQWQEKTLAHTIREALCEKNHQILVAESNGKVIGVLHQIFYPDIVIGGLDSHINLLLVGEEHRGKGVGSRLLKKAIENAREK